MKKITFLVATLMLGLVANAQYSESFEAFDLGDLAGQNGWGLNAPGGPPQVVDTYSTDGTQGVEIIGTNDAGLSLAFSPSDLAVTTLSTFSIDFNVSSGTNSINEIITQAPSQSASTTRVRFDSSTNAVEILVTDTADPTMLVYVGAFTYAPDTDYKLTQVMDFDNLEVRYLIDGVEILVGDLYGGTALEQVVVGGTVSGDAGMFFDNIVIEDGDTTLAVGDNIADLVSVFPNPATDVLNVRIPSDVTVTSSSLFDVLGKDTGLRLSNGTINTSNLAQGVYILNIQTDRGALTEKIIKQ